MFNTICYVQVLTGAPAQRMGLVHWHETGYYPCTYDTAGRTDAEIGAQVHELNQGLGVPDEVADSALMASMFGWDCPAAKKAIEFNQRQAAARMKGGAQ